MLTPRIFQSGIEFTQLHIHFSIQINTFVNFDKYILQFVQITTRHRVQPTVQNLKCAFGDQNLVLINKSTLLTALCIDLWLMIIKNLRTQPVLRAPMLRIQPHLFRYSRSQLMNTHISPPAKLNNQDHQRLREWPVQSPVFMHIVDSFQNFSPELR